MSLEAWRDYASAPPDGTAVCPASELRGASCRMVRSENGDFPLIVVAPVEGSSGTPTAYVNACPHLYLPLNYRGANILSADGGRLICSSHGAAFRVDDGRGIEGFGLGEALDPVPLHVDAAGTVRIGRPPSG